METLTYWAKLIFDKIYEIGTLIYEIRTSVGQWSRSEPYMIAIEWKSEYNPSKGIDTSHYTMPMNPPINLESIDYCFALLNLETYFSFPNINETNNTLEYWSKTANAYKTISLPTGAYNIFSINNSITAEVDKNGDLPKTINLRELESELKCELKIRSGVDVNFDVPNSIYKVLGFKKQKYGSKTSTTMQSFVSENIIDIIEINSIYVNCDLIRNSYDNGKTSNAIYTFFPNVPPSFKIIEKPSPPLYLPINNKSISALTVWLTNELGENIDFRGETITIRFYLQKLPLK